MVMPQSGRKTRKALLAVAAAGALVAFSSAKPVAIDLALHATSGHALLRLGFASVEFVFDSGQECPNPNGCSGRIL